MIARFKQDIQLSRKVNYANVCREFDLAREVSHAHGSATPTFFLTMEFLAGETLSVRLRRDVPLTFPEALALPEQMAAGLDAAHLAGVIHREERGTGNRGEREEEGEEARGGGRIVDANDTDLTAFRKTWRQAADVLRPD